jgi:hypothetical protein
MPCPANTVAEGELPSATVLYISHGLNRKHFENDEDIALHLQAFFDSKPPVFYKQGIMQLLKRWEHIVQRDGNYYIN